MKDCAFSLAIFGLFCLSATAAVKPSRPDADDDGSLELPALDSFMAEYDEILGAMSQEADALKTKLTEGRSSTWTQLLQKKKGYEHKLKGALRVNQKISGENKKLKEEVAKLKQEVDVEIRHLNQVQNSNTKSKGAMENLAKQLKVADEVIHKSIEHVKEKAHVSVAAATAGEKKIRRSDIRRVEVAEETPDEKDAEEEAAFLGEAKKTKVEVKGKTKVEKVHESKKKKDVSKKASHPEKLTKEVQKKPEVKTSGKEPAKKLDKDTALPSKVGLPNLAEKNAKWVSEKKWEEAYATSSGHVPLRLRVQQVYDEQNARQNFYQQIVSKESTVKNTKKHETKNKADEHGATEKKAIEKGVKHAAANGDKHVAAGKKQHSSMLKSALIQTTRDRLQDSEPANILNVLRENVQSMQTEQDSSEQKLWNEFKEKVRETFRQRRVLQHEQEDLKERKRKLQAYKLELEDSSKKAEHVHKFLVREVNKESNYLRKVQQIPM